MQHRVVWRARRGAKGWRTIEEKFRGVALNSAYSKCSEQRLFEVARWQKRSLKRVGGTKGPRGRRGRARRNVEAWL